MNINFSFVDESFIRKKVESGFSNLRAELQSVQGTMLTDQSIKGLQFCGGLKIQG